MQVTYNGFTGELAKLEKSEEAGFKGSGVFCYNLSIYSKENRATISFSAVRLEDVKFLGGAVTFGG